VRIEHKSGAKAVQRQCKVVQRRCKGGAKVVEKQCESGGEGRKSNAKVVQKWCRMVQSRGYGLAQCTGPYN
jgi:hypothetical protein